MPHLNHTSIKSWVMTGDADQCTIDTSMESSLRLLDQLVHALVVLCLSLSAISFVYFTNFILFSPSSFTVSSMGRVTLGN